MASLKDRQHKKHGETVDAQTQRDERLSDALRINLRRRKAQAQARKTESTHDNRPASKE
mgnify:FL=1|jgi:hypothetical protein